MSSSKQHIGAVHLTRRFRAPPQRVFEAWLDPALVGRWLFATATRPMTDVAIDARVGGSFRLVDRGSNGISEHQGKYVEIVPHRRLVFTLVEPRQRRRSMRVVVEITPCPRGCDLRLSHENLSAERASDIEARWTGILYGLGETLASYKQSRT